MRVSPLFTLCTYISQGPDFWALATPPLLLATYLGCFLALCDSWFSKWSGFGWCPILHISPSLLLCVFVCVHKFFRVFVCNSVHVCVCVRPVKRRNSSAIENTTNGVLRQDEDPGRLLPASISLEENNSSGVGTSGKSLGERHCSSAVVV